MTEHYDVVIVGGGSAGCVAAARLSEDSDRNVLLLDRSPDPQPLPEIIADHQNVGRILLESPYIEMLPAPRNIDGSVFYALAGRILGGGSSVNFMTVIRAQSSDFDRWVEFGNPEWAWEKVLPAYKRLESDQDYPDHPSHGNSGPLYVKRRYVFDEIRPDGLERAFIDGAAELGYPTVDDQNLPNPFGVSRTAYNVKDGRRQSSAVAFLGPARGRPNLTIIAEALVHGLDIEGDRVTGVSYEKDGETGTVSGDQICLCAGAYGSPQILMLSGMGPSAELERHGIQVMHGLEGVGGNHQDHAVVFLQYEGAKDHVEDWIAPGIMHNFKSDPALEVSDLQAIIRQPAAMEGLGQINTISVHLLEQRTRGRVFLQSTDPKVPPGIDPQMLEDPGDIRAIVKGMEIIDQIAKSKPMAEFYGNLFQPDPNEDWPKYARSTYDSFHHGVGTCMMGPSSHPGAVVDERLRVHGMSNLWIGDASIMPVIVHAHTNNTSLMIGERLSDFVKEGG